MKTTGVCPQCASTDIHVNRRRTWATLVPLGRTIFNAVYTSSYICTSCGFVETWLERKEDLEKIRAKFPAR